MAAEGTLRCRRCQWFVRPLFSWAKDGKVIAVCPQCASVIEHLDPTGELLKKLGPRPAPKPTAEPATLFDSPEGG